jgi:acyl-CoA synthetase (AMP-forming)/AMP-acid ligase II
MALAFLGVAAYATCAPLNPGFQAAEFRYYLEDIGAQVLIVRHGEAGTVRKVADEMGLKVIQIEVAASARAGQFRIVPDLVNGTTLPTSLGRNDIALIVHTSGTTGRPKLVPISQLSVMATARTIAKQLALKPTDRCLNVMPLFHTHGLSGALLSSLLSGGSVVCVPSFDERLFFDWVAEFEPSWYTAVPTIHQSVIARGSLYRQKAPHHRFRFARSTSAALSPATWKKLEVLMEAPVVETYAMAEVSPIASNPLPPGKRVAGSVGTAAAGMEVAIMGEAGQLLGAGETGEIVVRGDGVFKGYENNAPANATAFTEGWFHTGDRGRLDHEGYLFISGRLKEIVNRGGEKISPREVDDALLEHASVAQAVTFAVPHPSLGEDLAAAVVLRAGGRADESELRQFLLTKLSDFKVPSQIVFVQSIPKGATGKVQRTTLYQKLGALLERAYVAPGNEIERSVEAIFREVLECRPLSIHDNFFAMGGDSLKGARVMARINARHELQLPAVTLFRQPSIAELVKNIERAMATRNQEEAALMAEINALSDEEVEQLLQD